MFQYHAPTFRVFLLVTLCSHLVGCGTTKIPLLGDEATRMFTEGAAPAASDAQWWRALQDDTLNALVESALSHNYSLRAAVSRLKAAQTNAQALTWSLTPTSSFNANLNSSKTLANAQRNDSQSSLNGSFAVGWEIPLFGRAQAVSALQTNKADLAHWDYQSAQLALTAELVRTYSQWQGVQAVHRELLLRATTLQQLEAATTLTTQLGSATKADVDRWSLERLQTLARMRDLIAQKEALEARMATLAGLPRLTPDALANKRAQWSTPVLPAVDAARLRQRPDVRSAEAAVGVAASQAGVARANLWPQFNLSGNLAATGRSAGTISVGSVLHIPLLDWFRLREQANIATSELEAAVMDYRQTVLTAWEEAQIAYADYSGARDRAALAEQSVALADLEIERQQALFAKGMVARPDLHKATLVRIDRRLELLTQQAATAQAWSRVVKATFVQEKSVPHASPNSRA